MSLPYVCQTCGMLFPVIPAKHARKPGLFFTVNPDLACDGYDLCRGEVVREEVLA